MRIQHRAKFRGPKGALNPMGLKVMAETTVEIYAGTKGRWFAREADTPEKRKFERLPEMSSDAHAKATVSESFQEQLTPWEMYDSEGRKLDPHDLDFRADGTVERKPPTHIGRGATESKKTSRAACGKTVLNAQVIKTGRPTCDQCRIIYDKEQQTQ